MRRPKRVPLPHFRTEIGACHACHHSLTDLSRGALGRALSCSPAGAARPQAARREGQEPPRRDAAGRTRRPHAGRHRAQPQRSARRLRVAAVARPGRRAGAPRRRAARQQAARAQSNCVPVTTVSTELFGTLPAPCYRRLDLRLNGFRLGRSSHRPTSGTAVSPPVLRMLRPPPPGGRILFEVCCRPRCLSNRIPPVAIML